MLFLGIDFGTSSVKVSVFDGPEGRAVEIGNAAFEAIGKEKCLSHLLNSPGNFTASKLAWVKQNEPEIYSRIDKILLPGDFIAMKFTGETTTSVSALSEGIFWD